MKNDSVRVALIIAVALVISAMIFRSGLKSFGHSIERAGSSIGNQRPASVSIPSQLHLTLGEVKIGNGGGGGECQGCWRV